MSSAEEKKNVNNNEGDENKPDEKKKYVPLDEGDIEQLKKYGMGPYADPIKKVEEENKGLVEEVKKLAGIKESDTGLAHPSQWNLNQDKQLTGKQPLQVARCTKIINPNTEDAKYMINIKQFAKYVVGLGEKVVATDIEEGMRVGVTLNKHTIELALPPKIDPTVTMMTVEEKPDITYADIGGCNDQMDRLREVVEMPLLNPEKFV